VVIVPFFYDKSSASSKIQKKGRAKIKENIQFWIFHQGRKAIDNETGDMAGKVEKKIVYAKERIKIIPPAIRPFLSPLLQFGKSGTSLLTSSIFFIGFF